MACASLACPPRPVYLFTPVKMYYCIWADIFLDYLKRWVQLVDMTLHTGCKGSCSSSLAWEILSTPGENAWEKAVVSIDWSCQHRLPAGLLALLKQQHGHMKCYRPNGLNEITVCNSSMFSTSFISIHYSIGHKYLNLWCMLDTQHCRLGNVIHAAITSQLLPFFLCFYTNTVLYRIPRWNFSKVLKK